MEVSLQSRLILAAKAARPKSAEIKETEGTKAASSAHASRTDSVNLADPAVETLRKQSERLNNLLEQTDSWENEAFDWEQAARDKYNKAECDRAVTMSCQEIARRIMRGDKVPPEDEQYLAENDPDAFKLAFAMRTVKKDPKVWKSVLKDEKYQPHYDNGEDYEQWDKKYVYGGIDMSPGGASGRDSISVTNQAIETLREQSERLKNLLEQTAETAKPLTIPPAPWEASEEAEAAKSQLDAMEEGLKAMRRCMEIARRIMRGDKVPPEDERYLMENDPDGFKLALAMRTPKKKPKEWESVLKDEKKSEQTSEGGEEAAPAESCAASGGTSGGGMSDTGGGTE